MQEILKTLAIGFILFKLFSAVRHFFTATPRMVSAATKEKVQYLIKEKPIFVASKTYCPYCTRTKDTLREMGVDPFVLELDTMEDGREIQDALAEITGQTTVPNIFINSQHIGGNSDLQSLKSSGKLEKLLTKL